MNERIAESNACPIAFNDNFVILRSSVIYTDIIQMYHYFQRIFSLFVLFLIAGCSSSEDKIDGERLRQYHQKGEYIYRKHDETLFSTPPAEKQSPPAYPWDKGQTSLFPKITKEFFRCKGSQLNPCHIVPCKGEINRYYDCGGAEKHSLPLRDGKEFIYSILIDLMNHVQLKTGKRVVITSGHRCPEHNSYVDALPENQYSKHMIGGEVSFYVQGMEEKPEQVIKYLLDFYKENARYQGQKEFEFQRYDKDKTNVTILPWYNKEIFIKLYQKKEGRNFDNRHPYPYISIQVRYDRDANEKVIYSWDKANRNYLRW